MLINFRWIGWNKGHATEHGVSEEEIESVVRQANRPFPEKIGDGKWLVVGPGWGGRMIQVICLLDPDDTRFVIHARPVTAGEKRRTRRRGR